MNNDNQEADAENNKKIKRKNQSADSTSEFEDNQIVDKNEGESVE